VTAAGLAFLVTAAAPTTPAYGGMHAPATYVLSEGGPAGSDSPGTVTPIKTATNTPGKAITAGKGVGFIASTPNSKTAYVSNFGGGRVAGDTVTPISTATNSPGNAITVGKWPSVIAITPNGKPQARACRKARSPPTCS